MNWRRQWTIWVWGLSFDFLLTACGGSNVVAPVEGSSTLTNATTIDVSALPDGIGRGFPMVSIDGVENDDAGIAQGALPPDFRLALEDGQVLTLRDLEGRPVLINFWATWCGPCRLEMPEIVHSAQNNDDLIVLAVNTGETLTEIEPFANEFDMTMPVVQDPESHLQDLYQLRGMPTSVFIDREGRIQTVYTGLLTADLLNELLAEIL